MSDAVPDLTELSRAICPDQDRPGSRMDDGTRAFVEALTFADADTILTMIDELMPDLATGDLPVWARNLAWRLVCLQRPDDPELLRAAASDLYFHGPDWDDQAAELRRRADQLDGNVPQGEQRMPGEAQETE